MKTTQLIGYLSALAIVLSVSYAAAAQKVYEQHENIVYGEAHGIGLLMDIFVPTGEKNGLAIIDVASGAWSSDRGKINDHKTAQMYDIFCKRGYTVFAIRPGSISKFSVPEMIANLRTGIRWVKKHADEYGIDVNRMGMTGASAGGHLACLATVTATDSNADTLPAATGVFFPPTDFLDWGGTKWDIRGNGQQSQMLQRLALAAGLNGQTDEQLQEAITRISPARLVKGKQPPFLLIHGDADPVVPLQQSEKMIAALKESGTQAELIIKKGGGHPWFTIPEEVKVLADWFDKNLKQEATASTEASATNTKATE